MFVQRDEAGAITGCYACRQTSIAEEELADDHPEVVEYFREPTFDERAAMNVDTSDRLLFEVNYNQENRLRALEGKAPIARAQYRDALIAEWKRINAT